MQFLLCNITTEMPSRDRAEMDAELGSRIPQSGDTLILSDGRRFVVANADNGVRGWWFTAEAGDGQSTLQGNLRLDWDSQARAWRPAGERGGPQVRRARRTPQARQKQLD